MTNSALGSIRYPDPRENLLAYRAFKWLVVSPALHLFCQARLYGLETLPKTPFIAVANHASNLDPLIIANCAGRPIAFMAKEELFINPILGNFIRFYGGFPVKRSSADRVAIRTALAALEAGWVVGLFIQGTRTPDGRVTDPQPGAALLSAKTGIPLVPFCIWGSGNILPRGASLPRLAPLTVRVGPLIPAPASTRREDLDRVNQECANALNQLLDLGR